MYPERTSHRVTGTMRPAYLNGRRREVLMAALATSAKR